MYSKFVSTLRHKKEETLWTKFVSTVEWWWILRISPNLYKILAVFFSCISVCIIWSELTFNVRRPAILSIAYYALNACGTNYAALEVSLSIEIYGIDIYSTYFIRLWPSLHYFTCVFVFIRPCLKSGFLIYIYLYQTIIRMKIAYYGSRVTCVK